MTSQAYYDHIEANMELLARDLETTTEVIEMYLGTAPTKPLINDTRVFIGGGEILPLWPHASEM